MIGLAGDGGERGQKKEIRETCQGRGKNRARGGESVWEEGSETELLWKTQV